MAKGLAPSAPGYVLVLGGANMDIAGTTHKALVAGDSNPGHIRSTPGGVARNVAENLARLGNVTHLLTAVGDDLYGRSLLEATQKAGVDVQRCWVLPGEATSTYLSLHGPDGDMAVAVNDMHILERLGPELLAPHAALVRHAAALVVDCNLPPAALGWLFALQATAPVFVDCVSAFKCQRIVPWLGQVHTLKVNRIEAQALSNLPVDTDSNLEQAARWLHTQGVQHVAISLGERGVYWSQKDASHGWHPALPTQVVNVTGAGDALMAGLVHAALHHQTLAQAIPFALACAALTVSCAQANHPGLSVESAEQLLAQAATIKTPPP